MTRTVLMASIHTVMGGGSLAEVEMQLGTTERELVPKFAARRMQTFLVVVFDTERI